MTTDEISIRASHTLIEKELLVFSDNCLSCDEIESPDKCNTTTECNDGNECFLMEVLTHDFKPAVRLGCMEKKNYCRMQCSNLAEFGTFTPEHMKQFFQYTSRLFHISSGEEFQAYVGIEDANQSGSRPKWVWEVSGQTMIHGMQTRFNPTHHTYCMVAIHRTYSSDHSYIAGLANVDCSKQYKPLCQIKLS
ncbi:unnamed protein product [Mytilus coruscus]|uniref:C-type lectin domain-containing protein n=1 Tax=Mytilus coruscus TaxID=42192 RepID=A0A6J8CQY3_MYTCO|nr:unnamed protein product [Mytilus coruscus]